MAERIEIGTHVRFDIAQGMATGEAIVLDAEYDGGWLYLLDVTSGDRADSHRNEQGELWACDFEITVEWVEPIGNK